MSERPRSDRRGARDLVEPTPPVCILAGGRSERFCEHPGDPPKACADIGGDALIDQVIGLFQRHGLSRFFICTGHGREAINRHFLEPALRGPVVRIRAGTSPSVEDQTADGPAREVTLLDTGESTMTGARVYRASAYLGDRFCLTYADGLADIDIRALLAFHGRHPGCATITGVRPRQRFGILETTGDPDTPRVRAFDEKPATRALVSGGFFVFDRSFVDRYLHDDPALVLEGAPLQQCASDGELYCFEHAGFWACVDTEKERRALDRLAREGNAPWLDAPSEATRPDDRRHCSSRSAVVRGVAV